MLNDPANDPPRDWPLRGHARRIRARHDWWVVEHGTGPEILLLHGAGDEQIPLSLAQTCFDAVGSKDKTFRVFTREEGGFHHCQVDNVTIGVHAMWDWAADKLKPGT